MITDWHDLIQRHIAEATTEEEASLLRDTLMRDDAVARLYLRYMNLDVALEAHAASSEAMTEMLLAPDAVTPGRSTRWLSWRPLASAAAGLVIGLFSASLVWAVAGPRLQAWHSKVLPVVNADFEEDKPLSSGGVPVQCGVWSGDYAESTAGENEVQPKHGTRMFRFLRSDSSLVSDAQSSRTGNMYQAVDMRGYRAELADGQARLDWSAWFQWVPAAEERTMSFAVNVWTFTGDPSILPANWRDHLYRETAKSGSKKAFDDSPRQWRELKGSMIMPPDTDFLVIELKAIPPEQPDTTEPYRFVGCYADDVRLVLNTADAKAIPALSKN